jgi:solute carrier family 25 phosphate transporter 3
LDPLPPVTSFKVPSSLEGEHEGMCWRPALSTNRIILYSRYEFWKKTFIEQVGVDNAVNYRGAIYLGSAGIAEFFADIALCPLEATRIRLVSTPGFANGLMGGFARIAREEGLKGFYSGFGPILFKQVPYTMAKFYFFEIALEALIKATGKPKSEQSPSMATTLNLTGGVIAGCAAAFVSQPADTLLSKINKSKALPGETTTGRLISIAKQLGVRGLFSGMSARFVMIGTLTAGQFGEYFSLVREEDVADCHLYHTTAIYSDIKKALGATGGYEIAPAVKAS